MPGLTQSRDCNHSYQVVQRLVAKVASVESGEGSITERMRTEEQKQINKRASQCTWSSLGKACNSPGAYMYSQGAYMLGHGLLLFALFEGLMELFKWQSAWLVWGPAFKLQYTKINNKTHQSWTGNVTQWLSIYLAFERSWVLFIPIKALGI
jgi:hypothetical protein